MRSMQRKRHMLIGDVCAVAMVLSAAACIGCYLLSLVIDDARIHAGIIISAVLFFAAGFTFSMVERY